MTLVNPRAFALCKTMSHTARDEGDIEQQGSRLNGSDFDGRTPVSLLLPDCFRAENANMPVWLAGQNH